MLMQPSLAFMDAIQNDPLRQYVELLVFGYGADGSTTFRDFSKANRTLTANGSVQHDTDVDVKGQSILFDGASDYLDITSASELNPGTSTDFCVEAYIRTTDLSHINTPVDKRDGNSGYSCRLETSGKLLFATFGSGSARVVVNGATTLSTNTVYHVAYSRAGTTARVFLGGAEDGSATQSGTVGSPTTSLKIGKEHTVTTRDFEGNLNWVRVTMGHARYTAAFTPPPVPFSLF